MKYINGWKLKRWQGRMLLYILNLIHPTKIIKGDKIRCYGIGYPHWKGEEFICTADFKDGTIVIKNAVRVAEKDFKKIN